VARRVRRTNGPLDLREQAILRAVIEEYVASATPVGSVALVERYGLGVSSATVRSILAELEGAGFLTHPHTSAGRMPTDAGYRYYVESIVDAPRLTPVEQLMIRHQFGQVEFASEHWFRLAATTLAGLTRAAGLATPAKPRAARVRRVDLVAIQERLASLILVLREGTIKQILLTLDEPADQATLSEAASRLNHLFADRTARQIDASIERFDPADPANVLVRKVAERIARTMREFDTILIEELFSDGLLNVMEAPEFAQSEKLRRVFTALENRSYLDDLLRTVAAGGRVRVFIGGENEPPEMHEVSLVLAPYGRPDRAVGVVGVLGPTRMGYPHAIGTVRFVSGLMNELVDHLYT
jgi:heat-inducible transcriptional repressor